MIVLMMIIGVYLSFGLVMGIFIFNNPENFMVDAHKLNYGMLKKIISVLIVTFLWGASFKLHKQEINGKPNFEIRFDLRKFNPFKR